MLSTVRSKAFFKFSLEELYELLFFFYPVALITFFQQLFLFVEKLLLAQLSLSMMETAVLVGYLAQVFQISLVIMAMMAQVWVAKNHAAGDWQKIGPGLWQWIWFALLSMVISIPGNIFYGHFYLANTEIEGMAWPYFYLLIGINFLYPLGAVLSCFFLGMKKRRLVFFGSLGCHLLKLGLVYFLIFGWGEIIPAFGLLGGALAAMIAQGLYCLILLGVFLNRTHASLYRTREWQLNMGAFSRLIRPGLFRALSRIFTFTAWLTTTYLMSAKGGEYLLVLSLGGTLLLFSSFISEALCQAQTLTLSGILGGKNNFRFWPSISAGSLIAGVLSLLLTIPFLFIPQRTFEWLFPEVVLSSSQVSTILFGAWLTTSLSIFSSIPASGLLAFQDMGFVALMGLFSWLNGFLWMYWVMDIIQVNAYLFWHMIGMSHLANGLVCAWRLKYLMANSYAAANVEFGLRQSPG